MPGIRAAQETSSVERAAEALAGRRVAVLTGAGISTDSGIPDYRGKGTPVRTPMSFQQFRTSEGFRQRYWAGSHLGWRRFHAAMPNAGHLAITDLETAGVVSGVITQNVDDLHLRAGTRHVVDLHGTMHTVSCMSCGQVFDREAIATRLAAANPWLESDELLELSPDGDVQVAEFDTTIVPECTVCGGMLKPDVVFFGEFVPTLKFDEATSLVAGSGALLVAGSSLIVNSGIRILELARRRRLPIVIINRGPTKGDARALVKIDAGTTESLVALRDLLAAAV
jgi:NAD-dependent SIR2 family protein deacetylase